MKKTYLFVEGQIDARFLRRFLPDDLLANVEFVVAGGYSGIPSLARSVLVRRNCPVAVVMDADSTDPEFVRERRESIETLIRAANAAVPVAVIQAIPMMEAWLFAAPAVIERTLGVAVPSEYIAWGHRDPKGALQRLAEMNHAAWDTARAIDMLDARDIENIRTLPPLKELTAFLKSVQHDEKAA